MYKKNTKTEQKEKKIKTVKLFNKFCYCIPACGLHLTS